MWKVPSLFLVLVADRFLVLVKTCSCSRVSACLCPTSRDIFQEQFRWDKEERYGSEYMCNNCLDKILSIIISRHTNARKIFLVNDRYNLPFSMKDDEHDSCASKQAHIPTIHPKPEHYFPGAAEFNKVMASSPHKVRLQGLVKELMKTHPKLCALWNDILCWTEVNKSEQRDGWRRYCL